MTAPQQAQCPLCRRWVCVRRITERLDVFTGHTFDPDAEEPVTCNASGWPIGSNAPRRQEEQG